MIVTHRAIIISILCSLGGDKKAIDLEILVVSCFKVFPSKFSMDRFSEYPRFDRVEKRMNEVEKEGLVRGDKTRSYRLTEKGVQWVKDNPKVSSLITKQKEKKNLKFQELLNYNISEEEYEIEIRRLKRSEVYRKYTEGEKDTISLIDFMTFMKVDIYTKKELFDRKVKRVRSICLREAKIREIFNYLENKYGVDYGFFNKEVRKVSRGPNVKGGRNG